MPSSPHENDTNETTTNNNNSSSTNPTSKDKDNDDGMPPTAASLRPTAARLATLTANLASVRSRIGAAAAAAAASQNGNNTEASDAGKQPTRLVAVSKLKPLSDIYGLLSVGEGEEKDKERQVHFGENYVQELLEKSRLLWDYEGEGEGVDGKARVGRSVRWHFIGGLQSNKAVQLGREVKGLWCVESVDSVKKARGLGKGWRERGWRREGDQEGQGERLRVMVQVNTSGEEGKSGVEPESEELRDLVRCVVEEEKERLELVGLMTIGAIARSKAAKEGEENEDFVRLKEVRSWVAKEFGWEEDKLELSMGMSDDFESAVRLGSGEVRIGSTIFGERPPKSEAKVV